MSRRIVVPMKEIYARRGTAWSMHYKNRALARELCAAGWDGVEITTALSQDYPAPELQIDATLLDIPLDVRRKFADQLLCRFKLSALSHELLCVWYWTESGWQDFVRQYQALPDVFEDYYFKYDPEPNDRLLLVPMSSKPKQGSAKKVQAGYRLEDNPVDKLGTSRREKVQVR